MKLSHSPSILLKRLPCLQEAMRQLVNMWFAQVQLRRDHEQQALVQEVEVISLQNSHIPLPVDLCFFKLVSTPPGRLL